MQIILSCFCFWLETLEAELKKATYLLRHILERLDGKSDMDANPPEFMTSIVKFDYKLLEE